ncbi:hypothetical protein [Demequina activiva]|nr:hypothetical protein [Demequina activiva]
MATPDFEEIRGRVRGLLIALGPILSSDEAGEVDELLEHAELGEGLRTLAWLIVEEEKVVAPADIREIESLAVRMGIVDELPPGLSQYGVDDG